MDDIGDDFGLEDQNQDGEEDWDDMDVDNMEFDDDF